jgi:hypothetical protein
LCIELRHYELVSGDVLDLDCILFHAGFTKMGMVAPGCEDQVGDAVLSKLPNANKYFYGNVLETGEHGRGHAARLRSIRV